MAAQEAMTAPPGPAPVAARPHVSFSPAALSAAVAEGLGNEPPASPPEAAQRPEAAPVAAAGQAADSAPAAPAARHRRPPARQFRSLRQPPRQRPPSRWEARPSCRRSSPQRGGGGDASTWCGAASSRRRVEEAPVEFATTAAATPVKVESEMRHVRVASSLDILAELETLRKASTLQPARERKNVPAPTLDLDALLQGSLTRAMRSSAGWSRTSAVSSAGPAAAWCASSSWTRGDGALRLPPVEVELKPSERIRELALTLTLNLQGT